MTRIALFLGLAVVTACGERLQGSQPAAAANDAAEEQPAAVDDELAFESDPVPGSVEPPAVAEARADLEPKVMQARVEVEAQRLLLAQEKANLEVAKAELDGQLDQLRGLEQRLDERLGIGEVARRRRNQRIGELADLLLNMPPQSAAEMVAKMDNTDAQALVLTMAQRSERKASKILSAMPGTRAAELGQVYLNRDPESLQLPAESDPSLPSPPAAAAAPVPEGE